MPSLFEEICFVPGPMVREDALVAKNEPSIACKFGMSDSERNVELQLPLVIRHTGSEELGEEWGDFCATLHQYGVALYCQALDLESVPASAVPIRVSKRYADMPFEPAEIATADIIELSLRQLENSVWQQFDELQDVTMLGNFLQAVREASSCNSPVGVEIPLGTEAAYVEALCEQNVDFLTLCEDRKTTHSEELGICSVAAVGRVTRKHKVPLVVDITLHSLSEMLKVFALGADAVALDSLVAKLLPKKKQSEYSAYSGGKLSSLGVVDTTKSEAMEKLGSYFEILTEALRQQLNFCGASRTKDLSGNARATSERAMRLTALPFLE